MGKVYKKVKREVIRVWYTMVFLYKEKKVGRKRGK